MHSQNRVLLFGNKNVDKFIMHLIIIFYIRITAFKNNKNYINGKITIK